MPLLQSIPEDELICITKVLGVQYFVEGDVIFRQGEVGDKLYLICEGTASVTVSNDAVGHARAAQARARSQTASLVSARPTNKLKS